jgi:putative endonuclease
MHWVYILECADGSLYTGIAANVERRLHRHASGKGAKYTQSHKPVRILYRERFDTKSNAAKREAQIKRWKREKKIWLIALQNKGA